MTKNEFLIQATLAALKAGKCGSIAACEAMSAARLLETDGQVAFDAFPLPGTGAPPFITWTSQPVTY